MQSKPSRRRLWALWVLTTIAGWTVGTLAIVFAAAVWGESVCRSRGGGFLSVEGGSLTLALGVGAVVAGLGQWFVLRQLVRRAGWWVPVTAAFTFMAGLVALLALGMVFVPGVDRRLAASPVILKGQPVLVRYSLSASFGHMVELPLTAGELVVGMLSGVLAGALGGMVLGWAQGLLFRRWSEERGWWAVGAGRWMVAVTGAWAIVGAVIGPFLVLTSLALSFEDVHSPGVIREIIGYCWGVESWLALGSGPFSGVVMGLATACAIVRILTASGEQETRWT